MGFEPSYQKLQEMKTNFTFYFNVKVDLRWVVGGQCDQIKIAKCL